MKKVQIDNMHELIECLNSFKNCYAFRGQANAEWQLVSSLERITPNHQKRKEIEDYTFNEFKKKFSLYSKNIEKPENKLSWLSLMQHYGIPTRLLDFTTSPYVALYFSIENLEPQDGKFLSLYAINYTELTKKSFDFVKQHNSLIKKYENNFYENCEEVFSEILETNSYDVLWFVDPKQLNDRIEKQAGTFLISGSFNKSIHEIINSEIYEDIDIQQISIPHHLLENIYALLRKINLGPKNIYGNIEGLAKDLQLKSKIYSK